VAYTGAAGGASLEEPLTKSYAAIQARSRQMQAGHYQSYTNIGAGIEMGVEELETRGRGGTAKLIVLLSDGIANRPHNEHWGRWEALRQAGRAADGGYRIVTISLGIHADHDLMAEIAAITEGVHFVIPGDGSVEDVEDDLIEVFTKIVGYRPLELVR
jgi:Mg-chelatase subunit ChlD